MCPCLYCSIIDTHALIRTVWISVIATVHCYVCCTGETVVVPDALVRKLVDLRSAYALLLMRFERALERSSEAQGELVAFLRRLLRRAVPSDCDFHSAFEALVEEELSLFNIYYLKRVSKILPGEVR